VTQRPQSRFVAHEPCPSCGSKDNLARYTDGHAYCFKGSCGYREGPTEGGASPPQFSHSKPRALEMTGVISGIPERRISEEVCRKYGVTVEFDTTGKISKHHYPYYDSNKNIVQSKVRTVEGKKFYKTGDTSASTLLFGQNTCSGKGKLTVVEGELDVLAVSEMFSGKFDVVSVRNGAGGAKDCIKDNLEFLEGYTEIRFCFDMDTEGQKAYDACKEILTPGKVLKMDLPAPFKDAGAMLVAGKQIPAFMSAFWDAKIFRPDGVVAGVDTWDSIVERRATKSFLYPYDGLNRMTKGYRAGDVVVVTSGTGMGKTQFMREFNHFLRDNTKPEDKVGILALEEDTSVTAMGLMSIEASRPLHMEEDTPNEELKPYWEKTMGTGKYFLFDHFGSTSEDRILNRMRYMIKGCNCNIVILDHLSIVVSDQEGGDERKVIDAIMTKMKTLAMETGASVFIISHLKRPEGKTHEEGGRVTLGQLRGSGGIAQIADMTIALERDQQHEDPEMRNISTVRILKNRFTGETGICCYLQYSKMTGRMVEVAQPSSQMSGDL